MKDKLKSKGFWISLTGAVVVLMQTLGVKFDVAYVNEVISAVCAVLIVVGVMVDDVKNKAKIDISGTSDENLNAVQNAEVINAVAQVKEETETNEENDMKYITDYLD